MKKYIKNRLPPKKPRSAVRKMVAAELAKGPRTLSQLSAVTGAEVSTCHTYVLQMNCVRFGKAMFASTGRPQIIWALPDEIIGGPANKPSCH